MKDIVKDVNSLAKNLSANDTIVIVAGYNDFLNQKYPSFGTINLNIKNCTHTNIIFASVPYSRSPLTNHKIYKYNHKLFEFVLRLDRYIEGNISYLEVNDINGNQLGIHELCKNIVNMINKQSCQFNKSNLMFVKTSNEFNTNFLVTSPNVTEIK